MRAITIKKCGFAIFAWFLGLCWTLNSSAVEIKNTCHHSPPSPIFKSSDSPTTEGSSCFGPLFNQLHHWQVGTGGAAIANETHPRCAFTLIGRDLVITAGHCLGSDFIAFEFGAGRWRSYAVAEELLFKEDAWGKDYAILRLDGSPGDELGWSELALDQSLPQMGAMIHYPDAVTNNDPRLPFYPRLKSQSCGAILGIYPGADLPDAIFLRHQMSSANSSAGAPILDETGRILGVHVRGGCSDSAGSYNHGIPIDRVVKAFQQRTGKMLQEILPPKIGLRDGDLLKFRPVSNGKTFEEVNPFVGCPVLDSNGAALIKRVEDVLPAPYQWVDHRDGSLSLKAANGKFVAFRERTDGGNRGRLALSAENDSSVIHTRIQFFHRGSNIYAFKGFLPNGQQVWYNQCQAFPLVVDGIYRPKPWLQWEVTGKPSL